MMTTYTAHMQLADSRATFTLSASSEPWPDDRYPSEADQRARASLLDQIIGATQTGAICLRVTEEASALQTAV